MVRSLDSIQNGLSFSDKTSSQSAGFGFAKQVLTGQVFRTRHILASSSSLILLVFYSIDYRLAFRKL